MRHWQAQSECRTDLQTAAYPVGPPLPLIESDILVYPKSIYLMFDQVYSPTHYAADEAAGVGELLGNPVYLDALFGYSHILTSIHMYWVRLK
jgi:hypothetical protein